MLADGLTKDGTFEQLLIYVTTGRWKLQLSAEQWVRIRVRVAYQGHFEESDLLELDW